MSYKYSDLEKEYLKEMLTNISYEHASNNDMKSDDFAWLIFQKITWTIKQILIQKDKKFISLINGLIPPERGEEECDCTKGLGNCGCRVKAYNECREEIEFAVNLANSTIIGKIDK